MAGILMLMAHIFTMLSFWRYMALVWSTWKHEDFLQVQSKYCKRLCHDIVSLEKCLKAMEASSKTKVLNKNQCIHLFRKLILAMKGIDKMLSSATKDLKFQSIFEELCRLKRRIEIVGKKCIEQDQWCHLVVIQLQNKETFRELLLDLKNCYDAAHDMYISCHPSQSNNILPIQFDAAINEQVFEDGEELKRNLELVLQAGMSKDYEIGQHLLLRLRNLDRVDGGDLDALEILNDFNAPKLIKKIGVGSYGQVFKSNWLGLACATKILKGDFEFLMKFRKEAGILAGLSHPNLVQFFGCGINKKIDENHNEGESSEMHLVMELMESSLSTILKKTKRPLSYHLAIDIMHQIAKGVYYLHDMQVAHLDLKPDNILSSSIFVEDFQDSYCIFKVSDYGTSQLEVCSNPMHPKPSKYTIGTLGYMAPEMIKESKSPLYPFQADVWSFAMICSEILSKKAPYSNLNPKDFYDQMIGTHGTKNKNLRPNLPDNCEELTNLIQECWAQDPLQRPTFFNICERLLSLKKSFLKGIYSYKMVPQFGSSYTLRDIKSMVEHVQKVNEQISPPKEIVVDLEHHLSKVKGLLKMNYVGIVGMGGIGKTTLAKAIFDDLTVNSLYHASCFVVQSKNYQNSYEVLCKVLSELGNDQKPNNFGDAQKMMKELLLEKKVLLILDGVNEEALVCDIVPANIVQASKGTTIILTTRKWSTIESFVGIEGRLDVELLDEKAATMLFTIHLSWNDASLSPDFVALRKCIVKACNGLPLSLKVMGAFLRHKERLRSWERALQRMARGRNLDGDEEIWNTLKISFDGLNKDVEKRMFLDLACFFCRDVYPSGISKETILYMWSKNGILPVTELERLIDMSLLKVNEDGETLEMHDQIRDMGRKIAQDTRIWKASMIPEIEFSNKGIKILEGISWQGSLNHNLPSVKQEQSFHFKNLRILILVSDLGNPKAHFDNFYLLLQFASKCFGLEAIFIQISNENGLPHTIVANTTITLNKAISNLCKTCASLKILDLIGLGFLEQLPKKFTSYNTLLRLDLSFCYGFEALPKEVGNLISLKTLNLNSCTSLLALPKEVGNLTSLTILDLRMCSSLVVLPKEVGNLTSLTTLNLGGCSNLVALPKEVGNLTSLTILNLGGCSSLAILPKEVGNLTSLTTLNLGGCLNLAALPKELGNLTCLTTLDLNSCSSLVALPKEVGNLTSLTILDLSLCTSLIALPIEIGNLTFLTTFNLRKCSSMLALPNKIQNLTFLTTFNLRKCSSMVALPKELGCLISLTTLDLSLCLTLAALPKEIRKLVSLTTLDLWGCSNLVELPKELGNLTSLKILHLGRCSSLMALPKEVGNLTSLRILDLSSCTSLETLPKEVGNLHFLTILDLEGCSSLGALPNEMGNLTSLITLHLEGCSSLVALPKEVGNLTSLITLDLRQCSSLISLPKEVKNLISLSTLDLGLCLNLATLSKEVWNLTSLTTLHLGGCSSLVELPREVGNFISLKTLNLSSCANLVALPKEVGNLTSLTTLDLSSCSNLVALPKEVGNLTSSTTLDLSSCSNLVALPKEVGNLTSLTTLHLGECSSLTTLPKEVGNLTSLTTLDLKQCSSLTELPNELEKLYCLIKLILDGCVALNFLPKNFGFIPSIRILSWNNCSNLEAYMYDEMSSPTSLASLEDKFFCLEGDHHFGVVCDGCNVTPIIGPCTKAKATFKIDYDLCLECYTKLKLSLENSI